jgi:ribonuclease BN (tRNA processing enzyme)
LSLEKFRMKGIKNNSKIVLLGSGTPNADPERSGPALAIVVRDTSYLVDFGPGVVRRAAAAFQVGIEGLEPKRLTQAFLTHLHSDHTAGYADLILSPWVLERTEPLTVFGPLGLAAMTQHLLEAYKMDIRERINGLEPINSTGWQVKVHEIEAGIIYEDVNVRVEAFPVVHGSWQAFGYKFYTPDRVIVVSGDTAPAESLVAAARDCDVLIHEVYSAEALRKRPVDWQRYHTHMHTSSNQLAEVARRVRPGLLILYHQLMWDASEEDLLAELSGRYSGKIVSGRDIGVY